MVELGIKEPSSMIEIPFGLPEWQPGESLPFL
jgi:hypothetical protein